jgi:EAL domain-containing protein (putative c-di-GMP-specific phosphodiesterase class I)/FixJ family two-component response regulator
MILGNDRKQILIVDSQVGYVNTLIQLLQDHNFDALTAVSSQGAFQKAQSLDVDLIIIGEEVEDTSALALCQQLKNTRRTEHIPVMLLTSNSDVEYRVRGYHHGADDCLFKVFDKEEFFARMDAIWRRGNGEFKTLREERQREVVQELSRIIDKGLVEPHFQPIYFIKPFRLFGIEVLSRPSAGSFIKNADELFKSAIKYDMYYALEMLCWQKAIDQVSACTRNEQLFFNCSPYIVENSKFQSVKDIFQGSHIPFNKVILEITERSAIKQYDTFFGHLNEYRDQGFTFAVDDVGGGYASLESIVATKPEIVKIDIHIVRNAHLDPIKQSIIRFIVAFCKENKILSVAEGVETKEEMELVSKLGVDAVQGYYLFRPASNLNVREMKDLCVAFN